MAMKVLLAFLLLAAACVALVAALELLGRGDRKGASAGALRSTHRAAGYAFAVLLVVLVALGVGRLSAAGDQVSLRVVFHMVFALGIVAVLLVKVLVARFYRQLLKLAPALGLFLFVLTLVAVAISAGFTVVTGR